MTLAHGCSQRLGAPVGQWNPDGAPSQKGVRGGEDEDRGYPCEGAIRAQPHGLVCGGRIKPCEPHGSNDNGV